MADMTQEYRMQMQSRRKELRRASLMMALVFGASTSLVVSSAALASPESSPAPGVAEDARRALERAAVSTGRPLLEGLVDRRAATIDRGMGVTVPETSGDFVRVGAEGDILEIGMPRVDEPVRAITSGDGLTMFPDEHSVNVPLVKGESSVQFTTVILDASAPKAYTYDLPGTDLTFHDDGLVSVKGPDGDLKGLIAPAWAVDDAGQDVATHYEVHGSSLTQIVEHTSQYPVVADPYLGRAQIASSACV